MRIRPQQLSKNGAEMVYREVFITSGFYYIRVQPVFIISGKNARKNAVVSPYYERTEDEIWVIFELKSIKFGF